MGQADDRDKAILSEREALFNTVEGARVGDYLKLPDGTYTRFTHDWPEKMQTGGSEFGSYYLGGKYCQYSGGLDSGVYFKDIKLTDEKKKGQIWFFHHNYATAHNGVYFSIEFRVFELLPDADTNGLPQLHKY